RIPSLNPCRLIGRLIWFLLETGTRRDYRPAWLMLTSFLCFELPRSPALSTRRRQTRRQRSRNPALPTTLATTLQQRSRDYRAILDPEFQKLHRSWSDAEKLSLSSRHRASRHLDHRGHRFRNVSSAWCTLHARNRSAEAWCYAGAGTGRNGRNRGKSGEAISRRKLAQRDQHDPGSREPRWRYSAGPYHLARRCRLCSFDCLCQRSKPSARASDHSSQGDGNSCRIGRQPHESSKATHH